MLREVVKQLYAVAVMSHSNESLKLIILTDITQSLIAKG